MEEPTRIDKWLWAVRVFKTRSLAAEACKKSKVRINSELAKPSKSVRKEDIIILTKRNVTFTYKVKEYTQNRVSAKLVSDYLINLTPQEEIDKLLTPKFPDFGSRERGTGRPTKKERRTIDNFRKKT